MFGAPFVLSFYEDQNEVSLKRVIFKVIDLTPTTLILGWRVRPLLKSKSTIYYNMWLGLISLKTVHIEAGTKLF